MPQHTGQPHCTQHDTWGVEGTFLRPQGALKACVAAVVGVCGSFSGVTKQCVVTFAGCHCTPVDPNLKESDHTSAVVTHLRWPSRVLCVCASRAIALNTTLESTVCSLSLTSSSAQKSSTRRATEQVTKGLPFLSRAW